MQTEPGKWAPANIVAGYLTLLGAAYFDSMRGPLVPVLVQSLHIPYAKVGWFLTVGNIVAVVLLGLLNWAFRRFGEKRVGIATCLLAAAAGLIAPWVVDYPTLILLGVVIGGSIALMGAICNIYTLRGTPDAWKSRMLAGNHFMYGLGSFGAPLIVSAAIARGLHWSWLVQTS